MAEAGAHGLGGGGDAHQPVVDHKAKYARDQAIKDEVKSKVIKGDYSTLLIDEGNPDQSPAWKKFARVVDPATQQQLPFVVCRNINCRLVKMVQSGGRGHMAKHVCPKTPIIAQKMPSAADKDKFTSCLVNFCVDKILPMTIVEGEAFYELLQCAMKIALSSGSADPKAIIPHPTTLTRHIKDAADAARSSLVADIKEDLEDGFGSATVDGWTDDQRGRKYLTHTVSLISEDFELREHVLFTPHCDATSVTADVIDDSIKTNMSALGLDPTLCKLHYVTDDGADIVCAVKDSDRSYCADHCTNLTVKKAITVPLLHTDLYGKEGGVIVDAVQRAVDVLKSSRLRKLTALKRKLTVGPKNRLQLSRFKSCLPMLSSVRRNFQQVKSAMSQMGHSFFDNVTEVDLAVVIEVVAPIEALAQKQADKNFVGAHHEVIQQLTAPAEGDTLLHTALKEHIKATLLHIVTFLVLMQKLKAVVTLMKTSGLNETLLGGTLKQEVETRWMSNLRMLKSFFVTGADADTTSKIDQINQILTEKKRTDLLITRVDVDLMQNVMRIFSGFDDAIKTFEASKEPTIQHVLPQFYKLKKIVEPSATDSDVILAIKKRLKMQLEKKLSPSITMRHKIGTFLWPKFSTLPFACMDDEERDEIRAAVRDMCAKEAELMDARRNSQTPSPAKRMRAEANVAGDATDSEDEYSFLCDRSVAKKNDEVDDYILMSDPNLKSRDILKWWKQKSAAFPILSRVARKVLATPASSSASERVFSVAGRLITSRRNSLASETVDDVLFLHDFLKKKRARAQIDQTTRTL